MQQFARDASSN